jgi:hypothetical protein
MAYAAAPIEPKRRPAIVTVACWLLYLAAACQVLTAIVTLGELGRTKQAYQKVLAETPMKGNEDMFVAIMAASAVVGLVFAIGYVVLAILNGRGKNSARIGTWVIAGVALCFSGCTLALSGLSGNSSANGAPSAQEIQQALNNAWPGWYQPTLTAMGIISFAALVAVAILLALPIANEFFRKTRESGWEPPVPPVSQVPPPTA